MSNVNETFLYSVNPKKPITEVPGVSVIRTPKSLYLTKEDVYTCLKKAIVYRRFAEKNERVTTANVDRVHRAEYIPEDKWDEFQTKLMSEGSGNVVDTTPITNESNTEEISPNEQVAEPISDESVEDTNIESQVDETTTVEENSNDEAEVANAEESTENEEVSDNESEDAAEIEDDTQTENNTNAQNNTNQYNHYNKKNKNRR